VTCEAGMLSACGKSPTTKCDCCGLKLCDSHRHRPSSPFFVDYDGKTVLTYRMHSPSTIRLSDGRVLITRELTKPRLFATHPDDNPHFSRDEEGVYVYTYTNGVPCVLRESGHYGVRPNAD
jgi:hypothetical protein